MLRSKLLSYVLGRFRSHIPFPLDPFEKKISSQFGEDGIIEAIFSAVPPHSRSFVEFGIGPNWLDKDYSHGLEGNCVRLRDIGWTGLFMDAGEHPEQYDIKTEFITADNVNRLFRKYHVPRDVDVISIDVDGQDFWIWQALDYSPTLYIVEYNGHKPATASLTVPFDPDFRWDGSDYYGASLRALNALGTKKGYTLVFANGVNAFFVKKDRVRNATDFVFDAIFRPASNHHADPLQRPFVTI